MDDHFDNSEDEISGFFDDDGNKLNSELAPKPGLCLICRKEDDRSEEALCMLNRLDQADEVGEFQCGVFEPK